MDEINHKSFFVILSLALLGLYGAFAYMLNNDGPRHATAASTTTVTTAPTPPAPAYNFYVGQPLYSDGFFGRVVKISQSHVFENGAVEPGVLLTFREREGMEHTELSWLPMRSAANMIDPSAR